MRLTKRNVSTLVLIFYAILILIHILILLKVIPYTEVNGGRSTSYDMQAGLSIFSIIVGIIGSGYVIGVKKIKSQKLTVICKFITWILVVYWCVGLVMQLLGTNFERFVLSGVLVYAIIVHILLALTLKVKKNECP